MRAKRVGADQVGAESFVGDTHVGRGFGIAHCRISVILSLAALLVSVLHGVERLRCSRVAGAVDVLPT